jgi:hypothetical protein
VNFELPGNAVSPYVPVIADFSNANTSNGMAGYSSINYTVGTTYTTTEAQCHVILGQEVCSSTTVNFGTAHTYDSSNGNDVVSQQYNESGILLYDAMNRTSWLTQVKFYQTYGNPESPALQAITDYLTPKNAVNNSSIYLLPTWGETGGVNGSGVRVFYDHPQGGAVNVSSVVPAWLVKKQLQTSIQVGYGTNAGTVVRLGPGIASLGWSQAGSSTSSYTLTWTASVLGNTGVPTCFVVYGVGGSQSVNSADAIGIWEYAPTWDGTQYTCPHPTVGG